MKRKSFRKIICFSTLYIISTLSYSSSNEDGWKYLKWGMDAEDIKAIYEKDDKNKEACRIRKNRNEYVRYSVWDKGFVTHDYLQYSNSKLIKILSLPLNVRNNLSDIIFVCDGLHGGASTIGSGLLFYKKRFFGKIVHASFEDKEAQEVLLRQLKERFPDGKSYVREEKIYPGGNHSVKIKYPVFEYVSEKITVFNTNDEIFFYDTNALKEIIDSIEDGKKEEEIKRRNNIKNLF